MITTTADIPALGSIAIDAFVLHGTEPVLVDTGTVAGMLDLFVASLAVAPAADRFVGPDHAAALEAMLGGIAAVPA